MPSCGTGCNASKPAEKYTLTNSGTKDLPTDLPAHSHSAKMVTQREAKHRAKPPSSVEAAQLSFKVLAQYFVRIQVHEPLRVHECSSSLGLLALSCPGISFALRSIGRVPEKDFVSLLPREQTFPAEMIAAAAARIAVVSVLIAFQVLTFSIELHHYIARTIAGESSPSGSDESNNNGNALKREISHPERRRLLLRHGLALFVGLLNAILALAVITGGHSSGATDMEKMVSECSSPTVDADIAGEGIRIAIWAQERSSSSSASSACSTTPRPAARRSAPASP